MSFPTFRSDTDPVGWSYDWFARATPCPAVSGLPWLFTLPERWLEVGVRFKVPPVDHDEAVLVTVMHGQALFERLGRLDTPHQGTPLYRDLFRLRNGLYVSNICQRVIGPCVLWVTAGGRPYADVEVRAGR